MVLRKSITEAMSKKCYFRELEAC